MELQPPDDVSYQYLRAITGVQPKSSKIPPLVSEFAYLSDVDIPIDCHPPVAQGEKLPQPWHGIPAGACFLKKPPLRLKGGNDGGNDVVQPGLKRVSFGIFRTCDQFVDAAVAAGHPVSKESRLPNVLQEAVSFVTQTPPRDVARHRLHALKFWLERAKQLTPEEASFHSNLPSSLKEILAPKRLLLWKEMMEHYGYPDCDVFNEVVEGVQLSGVAPFVESFDQCFKPAKITEAELASTARAARVGLLASIRSSGDPTIDARVALWLVGWAH